MARRDFYWREYLWHVNAFGDTSNRSHYTSNAIWFGDWANLHFGVVKSRRKATEEEGGCLYDGAFICGSGDWSYGTYEWWTEQPSPSPMGFAVCLRGKSTWASEIVVFKCSTDKGKVVYETDVRYGFVPVMMGAKRICRWLCGKKNHWKLKWTKRHIKIYLNGWLVRKVSDESVLRSFNNRPLMCPIMYSYVDGDCGELANNRCDFVVRDFRYRLKIN